MKRVSAFFLSPVPAAGISGILAAVESSHLRPISIAIFYLLALYLFQLIFGLAIYAWLMRSGRKSIAAFVVGGVSMVAIPTLPYMIWAYSIRPENTLTGGITVFLQWLAFGAITGATCRWLTARGHALSHDLRASQPS